MPPSSRFFPLALLATLLSSPPAASLDRLACPAGEITLTSVFLRAFRRGAGRDELATPENTFVVPEGVEIDPAREPASFYVEADHRPLAVLELPAGALVADEEGFTLRRHSPGRGTSLTLRRLPRGFRLDARLMHLDLAGLDPARPPARMKQVVKLGNDCFSAVLACTARGRSVVCRPERSALLAGKVRAAGPLTGVMVTAYDDRRLESVSVFSQDDGHYAFPPLRPGTYRLRARLLGYEDQVDPAVTLIEGRRTSRDFALEPAADPNSQLPASAFFSLLLDKWPSPTIRGDFTLSCGNCHQIGAYRFRRAKTAEQWAEEVQEMMTFLPPYFQETRDRILPVLLAAYGPDATIPPLPRPPPPSGDVLRAVIYEYGLGDARTRPGCHDLELGADNVVYQDAGVRWIDPRTGERGIYPINGGAHSIERAPDDGNMWITQAGDDTLAKLDVHTGQFTYYPLPKIGEDQGAYPHTLRFDSLGRIWFTLTKSNHLALFERPSARFTYYRLPPSDAAETGLPIPVAYGCDVAPDDTVWFSQLFGQRIGHFFPTSATMKVWKPPFYGPRRLHAGRDGIVWVPGYGSGVLGRFDPATERWKVYPLPTGVAGPFGFGYSELPYSLNANRLNGEVWVTGSNSDTLIRFEPERQRFTVFPLPTRASYTREIEFDPDNNVWTCTSNEPSGPDDPGRGKFVKVELPPTDAVCGNGRREPGEECDDGNTEDCDGCSNHCRLVTGCGDGAVCGAEECDDGNADDCDGCSSSCVLEPGLRCGDGIVNQACGEECDPPGPGCSAQCTRVPVCGDGVRDAGEACDDGNSSDCDGCSAHCTVETGCGDGIVCGAEECDDGNTEDCDGCSAACRLEQGLRCGDGIVNQACGEQCDPPAAGNPECNYLCRLGPAPVLGTRHLSFGGSLFSSALGTGTPLGKPTGAFDLVGDAPGPDGIGHLSVGGPIFFRTPILGGSFGNLCVRISACTGVIDCNGGTPVGVQVVQDSAGPGKQGNRKTTTTSLGPDAGPGALLLSCAQATLQVPPDHTDCTAETYPPEETIVYTTGQSEGHYLNGDPRIGTGEISYAGENFPCGAWSVEDGAGQLAGTFLTEDDPQAGDTANVLWLDD